LAGDWHDRFELFLLLLSSFLLFIFQRPRIPTAFEDEYAMTRPISVDWSDARPAMVFMRILNRKKPLMSRVYWANEALFPLVSRSERQQLCCRSLLNPHSGPRPCWGSTVGCMRPWISGMSTFYSGHPSRVLDLSVTPCSICLCSYELP
jgi:hypothetical protein